MTFPLIEAYRAELRAMGYQRLSEAQIADAMRGLRNGKASNAIEGNYGSAEADAFLSLLLEEGVPDEIGNELMVRFIQDLRDRGGALAKAS
jgi:hypothetical protein